MSKYRENEFDESGVFQLKKRDGQVEMWHNPKTSSYIVILYEHANRDEEQLLTKTLYSKEKADNVFNIVVDILK